jgi:hypothetical protein
LFTGEAIRTLTPEQLAAIGEIASRLFGVEMRVRPSAESEFRQTVLNVDQAQSDRAGSPNEEAYTNDDIEFRASRFIERFRQSRGEVESGIDKYDRVADELDNLPFTDLALARQVYEELSDSNDASDQCAIAHRVDNLARADAETALPIWRKLLSPDSPVSEEAWGKLMCLESGDIPVPITLAKAIPLIRTYLGEPARSEESMEA